MCTYTYRLTFFLPPPLVAVHTLYSRDNGFLPLFLSLSSHQLPVALSGMTRARLCVHLDVATSKRLACVDTSFTAGWARLSSQIWVESPPVLFASQYNDHSLLGRSTVTVRRIGGRIGKTISAYFPSLVTRKAGGRLSPPTPLPRQIASFLFIQAPPFSISGNIHLYFHFWERAYSMPYLPTSR